MSVRIPSSFLLIHFSFSVNKVDSSENLELLDKWFLRCGGGREAKRYETLTGNVSKRVFVHECIFMCADRGAAAAAKSLQSCLTLCDPIDGSPPGSPVPGILQARTLGWVAISFSNA